jgi:3-hydroxyacyl-CoA dehydrogenase/enoyl-CoA hydratase/3-hydroxybutyryl-CoA epimerase
MSSVRLEKRPDGVAVVRFDTPGKPVNVLGRDLFEEFAAVLDEIEHDAEIRAMALVSGKKDSFIAGADLDMLSAVESAADGEAVSKSGHALLDRVAGSAKPVVAAIHGAALGGGLEVALACHYRLATDDPKTVLALPEVQLGLLPGAGGTQRLPRLVGLAASLPLLLTGKRIRARKARKLGLVDALTSPGGLEESAARTAALLEEGRLKPPTRKRSLVERILETAPGRVLVFRKARAGVQAKTRGLYPAPIAILDCVRTGFAGGPHAGKARESVLFGELTASPEARSLISLFRAMTDLKKPLDGPEGRPVHRLAILGGGFMGAGVAAVSIAHASVTVRDLSDEVLSRCARTVNDQLKRRVRSGSISPFQRDRLMARMHLTREASGIAGADLVVEAVFEDLELKRRVLAEAEGLIAADAVFASNTSAIPIADIARDARHPERVLGMHYFSPVPKMPLLELVVTPKTSAEATATARGLGVRQGKTVIVVRDGPGFYTTRILSPYLDEAVRLIEEGARIEDVDKALRNFGFPVGPLALLDEVGIDVAAHVTEEFGALYADRGLGASDVLPRMHREGLEGRKSGRGFYRYDDARRRRRRPRKVANGEVYALAGAASRRGLPATEIVDRAALLMINEAVLCLQQDVISCPRDGDVGGVLGLGFPPFRGGPFRYVDFVGAAETMDSMERCRERFGPRFEPAPLLRDHARSGRSFHPGG